MSKKKIGDVILDVKNISLSFGGVKALTDISFNVREHEICSIIGPNGAGKSSMLNCINGFYRTVGGSITGPFATLFLQAGLQNVLNQMQQLFTTINLQFNSMLTQFSTFFGPSALPLIGQITLQPFTTNGRKLASAHPAGPAHAHKKKKPKKAKKPAAPAGSALSKAFKVPAGKTIAFPKFGKVKPGTYTLKVVLRQATGGAPVTVVSPAFTLNAQGKVVKSLAPVKAKPTKKPAKKPKPRKKH